MINSVFTNHLGSHIIKKLKLSPKDACDLKVLTPERKQARNSHLYTIKRKREHPNILFTREISSGMYFDKFWRENN